MNKRLEPLCIIALYDKVQSLMISGQCDQDTGSILNGSDAIGLLNLDAVKPELCFVEDAEVGEVYEARTARADTWPRLHPSGHDRP